MKNLEAYIIKNLEIPELIENEKAEDIRKNALEYLMIEIEREVLKCKSWKDITAERCAAMDLFLQEHSDEKSLIDYAKENKYVYTQSWREYQLHKDIDSVLDKWDAILTNYTDEVVADEKHIEKFFDKFL